MFISASTTPRSALAMNIDTPVNSHFRKKACGLRLRRTTREGWGRGGDTSALGTRKLSSAPSAPPSSTASTAPCAAAGASAGSAPSTNPRRLPLSPVADLAYIPIRLQQCFRRLRHHLRIRICVHPPITLAAVLAYILQQRSRRKELQARFPGVPSGLVNYFLYVAEETCYISIATADVANVLGLPNGPLPMSERDDQLVGPELRAWREEIKQQKGRIRVKVLVTQLLELKDGENGSGNFVKVYRTDLFALWNMDTSTPVNMGVVCKRWLKAQQSKKVTTLFVGPLVTQLCLSLGYQARMEETNKVLGSAAMTPLSMTDLSELKIGRNLRMRTGTRVTKKKLPKKPKKRVDPSPPFQFSESPKPNTPEEQTHTPSDNQHHSSPTLSLNISISNDAPPSDDPNAIPSPSSPAAPVRFTKVTNWETMQRFQYELHMEHENLLEKRDARHYELIQDLSMQVAFLRE
nr:uncharacterized protein LOC109160869 [Ipomoea batatas]